MSVIMSGAHPKALWPGVKAWFGMKYNEYPLECTDLFDWETSSQAYEEDVETTGFGLAPVKAQGAGLVYDSHSQGAISRYTHAAYALGYIVTKEEIADNLYQNKSFSRSEALAFSMRQTRENVAANVYNRMTTSGYTGGDGIVLASASHPDVVGGTQSNIAATSADLSEVALEDLLIQIAGATNSRGLKISLMGQKLIVPRGVMFEAARILNSTLQSGTANNDINAVRSMGLLPGGFVVNHYLTDTDAWFIRTNAPRGLIGYNRQAVEFDTDNDFDTKNARASAYERYSVGWTDWRGLYANPGA
jgi:hypothetical protein